MGKKTLGKGEIARYEQFLFFLQCFQMTRSADTEKPVFVWERVKELTKNKYIWINDYAVTNK